MLNYGRVINPGTIKKNIGDEAPFGMGGAGQLLATPLGGAYYEFNRNGAVFTANVTAVTVPVVAATLVSVFSLYNPRNSGVWAELIDTDITSVLATLVVNTYGWYFSADKNADTATFTTKGTAQNGAVDGGPARNKVQFYSALTHVGTPVRWKIIGGHHATTSTATGGIHRDWNGSALLPPGSVISLAASTAAGTTSGLDLGVTWAEWPA